MKALLPLPVEAQRLCSQLQAPERLRRHLTLVHDVAARLLDRLAVAFPSVIFERKSILLGAATHDLGKTIHLDELTGNGCLHQLDGPALLNRHGLPESIARFARTHGTWDRETIGLDDLLIALADNIWKGHRNGPLETMVIQDISSSVKQEAWAVYDMLDAIIRRLTMHADSRLAWQRLE